jgi:hypothetical protein
MFKGGLFDSDHVGVEHGGQAGLGVGGAHGFGGRGSAQAGLSASGAGGLEGSGSGHQAGGGTGGLGLAQEGCGEAGFAVGWLGLRAVARAWIGALAAVATVAASLHQFCTSYCPFRHVGLTLRYATAPHTALWTHFFATQLHHTLPSQTHLTGLPFIYFKITLTIRPWPQDH